MDTELIKTNISELLGKARTRCPSPLELTDSQINDDALLVAVELLIDDEIIAPVKNKGFTYRLTSHGLKLLGFDLSKELPEMVSSGWLEGWG